MKAEVEIPPKLVRVMSPPLGAAMYRGLYGGRGSGKSQTVAMVAAIWGYAQPLRILCTREFQASIKESFHAELKDAIERIPWLAAHYDVGEDYLRGANGTEFIFRGLRRNSHAIKSLAKIDLTIVEEADTVPEKSWLDLEATVFRQPTSELIAIWNPDEKGSPVDRRFIEQPPENSLIAEINYWENPFFPKALDDLRQREKERLDAGTYAHIWEGKYLENSDSQVLSGKVVVQAFAPGGKGWHGPYYGGDFGFSQDPTAAVEVWLYDGDLYVHREAYKVGLELDDTASYVCHQIPGFDEEVSFWDNARPESVSHIKRHGLPRAKSVKKWPGSVEDGIAHLRAYGRIVVHPRCDNIRQESIMYRYKVDTMTDEVTSKIIDAHNHGIDAIRYALSPMIRKPKKSAGVW